MYTLIEDEAAVIRDADGAVVAPCQSMDDPAFAAYQDWIADGNKPAVLQSRGLAAQEDPSEG